MPSAPAHLRVLALLHVLACASCEEKRPGAPPVPSERAKAAGEGAFPAALDAGALGDPVDPPAPAGDLKAELDGFVNVDQCVTERAKIDPLVGDALAAIGYETFLRDACRLLEAARDRKRETCERIDSSALRSRCQSWVAMISQSPDACPMQFEGLFSRGRDARCVAVAAKDLRLCQGESKTIQRSICEAMVSRDSTKCDALFPNQRPLCQRELARWRSVLASPLEGLEKLPTPHAKLSIHGTSGTADPPAPDVDLSSDFARGVVVVTAGNRMRVELGSVAESEAARIAASPQKKARVGLAMVLDTNTDDVGAGKKRADPTEAKKEPVVEKLEVELPGEAPIVSPPGACDCKLTARVPKARGAEAKIALDGTVTHGTRSYKVTLAVTTSRTNVVAESAGTRVLPPAHPVLPRTPARAPGASSARP
ncbi:MAG TPA: hypothetical protein VM925_23355 [Labilithrix sp.]|nr:hypothetical protein [Labilithrix sp.]